MARHHSDDWFICPNCGEEVAMSAKSCSSCGADDETAWSEDAFHGQGLNLPDESESEVYSNVQNRDIRGNAHKGKWGRKWWFTLLLIAALAAFISALLLR